jgi:hypothetical protein
LRGGSTLPFVTNSGWQERRKIMRTFRLSRRLTTGVTGAALAFGALVGTAAPAAAAPPPEYDYVDARVSGNTLQGSLYWSSWQRGSGTVNLYDDRSDGRNCAMMTHRVMRGGVWQAWAPTVFACGGQSKPFTVTTGTGTAAVQYWQFAVRDAGSNWVYETNSPGAA